MERTNNAHLTGLTLPATTQVEQQVLDLLMELDDPESWLYRQFYGEKGVRPTLLDLAPGLRDDHRVLLKNETAHTLKLGDSVYHAASFKRRGAMLAGLLAKRANPRLTHFVTASHGNHGIGVAMAAKVLGMQAVIYCPASVNATKLAKLRALGAAVHHRGLNSFEEALVAAGLASERHGAALIHPYDQVEVIAGQATIGLEIIRDMLGMATKGRLDLQSDAVEISAAVAGGGLLTGLAIVLKRYKDLRILGRDNVRLYGAQMVGCDAARRTVDDLQAGGNGVAGFAEGEFNEACDSTAVREIGSLTAPFLADPAYVQGFHLVTEAEVGRSMRGLTDHYGKLIEPAGALAYASVQKRARQAPLPTTFIVPVCGSNVTHDTYRYFQRQAAEAVA